VASLSQGRTAAAQCGLFTHKSVPVIFEPPCTYEVVDSKRGELAGMRTTAKCSSRNVSGRRNRKVVNRSVV